MACLGVAGRIVKFSLRDAARDDGQASILPPYTAPAAQIALGLHPAFAFALALSAVSLLVRFIADLDPSPDAIGSLAARLFPPPPNAERDAESAESTESAETETMREAPKFTDAPISLI